MNASDRRNDRPNRGTREMRSGEVMPTCLSLFSGGGLADVGLVAAGYTPIGAVELDPAIAEVYRVNLGNHIRVGSVTDMDWTTFERPDLLWASPPCTRASTANANATESPLDLALADAVCNALRCLLPRCFVLENVYPYRAFKSCSQVITTLEALGYFVVCEHLNSADFGVPQTRRRLIIRAVRGGLVPHLPAPRPWVGWYQAIEDLLPTLPESAFAPWQLARLEPLFGSVLVSNAVMLGQRVGTEPAVTVTGEQNGRLRAFLVGCGNTQQQWGQGLRLATEPAYTTDAGVNRIPRAFLLMTGNTQIAHPTGTGISMAHEPTNTVSQASNAGRAWLEEGRVVKMTPRALARFQSVPDSYQLPEKAGLATKVIGNGVSCLLAEAIGRSLLEVLP